MATTTANKVFVDANVLVYSRVTAAPFHQKAVDAFDALTATGSELWISRQIVREFLTTVTRPQSFLQPMPIAKAIVDVRIIESTTSVADETSLVTQKLLTLLAAIPCGGKQIHDANLVATMLVNGIPNLLTHNVADFNRFGHLINIIPLVPPISSVAPETSSTVPSP